MATLDRAIQIAAQVHQDQKDKYGAPYILHPIRVMMRENSEIEKIVAILHDVVEDSDLTINDLRNDGFSSEIVEAVDALSKRDGEIYDDYINRTTLNDIAVKVKIADLEDNMDLKRIKVVTEKNKQSMAIYHKAWLKLSKIIS
jgi:(p)ppGpp synthase/HD superfamily hydrolase